jgi:hypothetical protein
MTAKAKNLFQFARNDRVMRFLASGASGLDHDFVLERDGVDGSSRLSAAQLFNKISYIFRRFLAFV